MSVRELTRQLGVSHNLVHHYFRSKADLWRAAIDHAFGTVSAELATAFRAAPAQDDVLAAPASDHGDLPHRDRALSRQWPHHRS